MSDQGTRASDASGRPDRYSGAFGFGRLLHDLRHRRHRHRQFVGIALVFLLTLAGSPSQLPWAIGAGIVVLGMAIRLWASGFVLKDEELATTGPYGYVRHPLYVGNLSIAFGICLASGLWWSWPLMLAMVLYFYPQTIRHEDKKLRRIFGEDWDRWAAETRALLPRLRPERAPEGERGSWSLRLSMIRNGEPIHIAIGLLCLGYLYYQLP